MLVNYNEQTLNVFYRLQRMVKYYYYYYYYYIVGSGCFDQDVLALPLMHTGYFALFIISEEKASELVMFPL